MNWYGIVMLLIFAILLAIALFWIGHWYWERRNNAAYNIPSADPSSSAPAGRFGWIGDKIRQFKARNSRTAAGAYEPQTGASTMYRGRNALDPDEAWSAHVGHEADGYGPYDEEHELGSVDKPNAGARYNHTRSVVGEELDRGRSRTRSPVRASVMSSERIPVNPFGDDAEPSNLLEANKKKKRRDGSAERRSVFRENM